MYLGPDHGLQIAAGRIKTISHINKFGYNTAVGTAFEAITDLGGTHSYIGTAGTAAVAGASDAGAVVEIQGLDANYLPVIENVTVGSSSTASFIRVFRARVITVASGTTNAGNITVTVDSAIRAQIGTGNGQTLMAVYTIPANKTGYLIKFQGSVEKAKECEFRIMTREVNGTTVFQNKGQFGSFGATANYDYPVPLKLTAKTDIEIRAKAGATTGMGAIFDLLLEDK